MLTIAVSGAGSLIGQGVIKSLRLSSLEHRLVALDYFPEAVGLYWADCAYLLPDVLSGDVSEDQFVERLQGVLRKEHVDVLLVATDFEVPLLARHRQALEAVTSTRIVVSSPEVAEVASDKWATVEFLRCHGYPYPRSLVALDQVDDFIREVGFPLVVKPRRGSRSRGVTVVHRREDLAGALAVAGDPIVQQTAGPADREFTCGAVVFDGECLGTIAMRRDLRDGNTYRAYVRPEPELERFAADVSTTLAPYGPVNLQLRCGPAGPTIFEINARFSGTTAIRALVGFNEVEAVVRAVRGERVSIRRSKEGVVFRYWEEQLIPWDAYEANERGRAR